jgi:RNA polymerase sigma-70 factor (ECF subfamily)
MTRMTEPSVVSRNTQPYVAIINHVTMNTIPEAADRLREVFDWIGARGIEMTDAPFFKYNVIDMAGELEIEVGIPIAATVEGEGEIGSGTLPAGRYVTVTHVGHPQELGQVTGDLLAWAEREGLRFAKEDTPAGEVWESRLEVYSTDPAVEPDMNKWETTLLFKLADD